MVLVYASNEDAAFQGEGLALAATRWPGERASLRNPDAYGNGDLEKGATAVVVQRRWTRIIAEYRATGIEVLVPDLEPVVVHEEAEVVSNGSDAGRRRRHRAVNG